MDLFNDNTKVCVICKQRTKTNNISISVDSICICKNCELKLAPIPSGSSFKGSENIPYIISAYYYNTAMKTLIQRYKFNGEQKIGDLLSEMLYRYIKDIPDIYRFDFITSVPVSYKRFLKRGYNQSEIMARSVSDKTGIPYVSCVYKKRHTVAQSLLKRSERIHNTQDAFISDEEKVKGKQILLFDDIFTTGSTLDSCAAELINKKAAYVAGITLAKTDRSVTSCTHMYRQNI